MMFKLRLTIVEDPEKEGFGKTQYQVWDYSLEKEDFLQIQDFVLSELFESNGNPVSNDPFRFYLEDIINLNYKSK